MIYETRMEKWKSYREQIAKNSSLQASVLESNLKFSILYNRLLEVFPEYPSIYKTKPNEIQDVKLKNIKTPNLFDTSKAEEIIEKININESTENISLQYIDNFEFSSGQVDSLIVEVKTGKAVKSDYVDMDTTRELTIKKLKKVVLPKGGE